MMRRRRICCVRLASIRAPGAARRMPALDRRKTAGWRSRASARRGWRRSACRRRTIPRESPACPVAEHIAGARQPSRPMPVVTRAGSRFRRRTARQAGPATPLGGPARDASERESLVGVDAGAGAQSSRRFLACGPAGSRPTARRGRRLQRPARGADDGATDGCVQRLVDGLSNGVESAPYLLPEEDPPESTLWTYRQRAKGHTTVRLFDHIWVDPETAERKQSAGILRRTK